MRMLMAKVLAFIALGLILTLGHAAAAPNTVYPNMCGQWAQEIGAVPATNYRMDTMHLLGCDYVPLRDRFEPIPTTCATIMYIGAYKGTPFVLTKLKLRVSGYILFEDGTCAPR